MKYKTVKCPPDCDMRGATHTHKELVDSEPGPELTALPLMIATSDGLVQRVPLLSRQEIEVVAKAIWRADGRPTCDDARRNQYRHMAFAALMAIRETHA
jgi:hypothetical protein